MEVDDGRSGGVIMGVVGGGVVGGCRCRFRRLQASEAQHLVGEGKVVQDDSGDGFRFGARMVVIWNTRGGVDAAVGSSSVANPDGKVVQATGEVGTGCIGVGVVAIGAVGAAASMIVVVDALLCHVDDDLPGPLEPLPGLQCLGVRDVRMVVVIVVTSATSSRRQRRSGRRNERACCIAVVDHVAPRVCSVSAVGHVHPHVGQSSSLGLGLSLGPDRRLEVNDGRAANVAGIENLFETSGGIISGSRVGVEGGGGGRQARSRRHVSNFQHGTGRVVQLDGAGEGHRRRRRRRRVGVGVGHQNKECEQSQMSLLLIACDQSSS